MQHAIERITAKELQAMSLVELGSSLNDCTDAMLALSRELQTVQERLAQLRVLESRSKLSGDTTAFAHAKESIFVTRAVTDNLKIRLRCVREIKSSLQTSIRSVGTL